MTSRAGPRCATLVLGLVLAATPAHASSWQHPDAEQDAISTTFRDGEVVTAPAPENESADVTRFDVHHQARRVAVVLHLRDVSLDGHVNANVRLRSPRASYVALVTQSPDDRGSVELLRGRRYVSCSRMQVSFRPRVAEVHVSVARSCLGDPRWIRAGASMTYWELNEQGTTVARFQDEALATGTDDPTAEWGPRLYPDPPAPPPLMTFDAPYGWQDHRSVGSRLTDGMAVIRVGAARGVIIERVRASFDDGVRLIGTRFAPPDRRIGGVVGTAGWPPTQHGLGLADTVPASGAHLATTGRHETWLLLLGYRVTEPGRHFRPTIRVDYRIGGQQLTARRFTPALICAGPRWRDRECELTDEELDHLGERGRARLITLDDH